MKPTVTNDLSMTLFTIFIVTATWFSYYLSEYAFTVFSTVYDLSAGLLIIASLLMPRLIAFPRWHRVGIFMCAFGLLAQSFRNIMFIGFDITYTDQQLPIWFLKDLGIGFLAFGFLWVHYLSPKITHRREASES